MAAKSRNHYTCSACSASSWKWVGQCPGCHAWNSLVESAPIRVAAGTTHSAAGDAQRPQPLAEIRIDEAERIATGIGELDRVLGGGLVGASVVLLGGDPGIGKSTLLLQCLAAAGAGQSVLYVTAEESAQQIALRARRLGIEAAHLKVLAENCLERIEVAIGTESPAVVVLDSIQTLYTAELQSAPGSVAQVRETGARLVRLAKRSGRVLLVIGHVTKEGHLAGPRVLEHMVDTVLYFEGDNSSRFRLIRAVKNRFGTVNEIGVFAMTEGGLREVANPSAMFIDRHRDPAPGSVVLGALEGTRPMMVEVQALVDTSALANPRRLCVGFEPTRLAMVLAVLHRHAGLVLGDQDVFVNIVGGVRVSEPAADLAVALAVASSFRNRNVATDQVVFGELGLAGEVRPVQRGIDRLREARKLGFGGAILPYANRPRSGECGIELRPVSRIGQCLEVLDE